LKEKERFPPVSEELPDGKLPPAPARDGDIADDSDDVRLELLRQLSAHSGNITHVARAMSKAPMQIYRWLRKYGTKPEAFRT
jgi:transcriptional regulator of acetoin/glycerol metabolism